MILSFIQLQLFLGSSKCSILLLSCLNIILLLQKVIFFTNSIFQNDHLKVLNGINLIFERLPYEVGNTQQYTVGVFWKVLGHNFHLINYNVFLINAQILSQICVKSQKLPFQVKQIMEWHRESPSFQVGQGNLNVLSNAGKSEHFKKN